MKENFDSDLNELRGYQSEKQYEKRLGHLESKIPPLIVPPLIVVALKEGALTCPVNVAPLRFALVASCELIEVIFAGVANKVDISEAPEYRVLPERAVPNTVLPAMFPPLTVPVNVAPLRFALVKS